jgi:hypothetical protein
MSVRGWHGAPWQGRGSVERPVVTPLHLAARPGIWIWFRKSSALSSSPFVQRQ